MNFNTFLSNRFIFVTFLLGTLAFPAFAQYGGYGNQYGGYNTGGSGGYGGYGGGYGGSNFGGMGSNRFGGGMGGLSGGMGMSRGGLNRGGMSGYGGMGGYSGMSGRGGMSSRGGMSGMSGRGTSRGGRGSVGGYNNAYGIGGYDQGGYSTGGRSMRSSRNSRYGGGNVPSGIGGVVPPSGAQGNTMQDAGQTQPTGSNSARRSALRGGAGGGGDAGGIQIQGGGANAGAPGAPGAAPGQVAPQQKRRAGAGQGTAAPQVKLRPVATLYADSKPLVKVLDEPFYVDILLSNPQKAGFDNMAFALKYDPAEMTPVDIDQGDFDSATEIRISEQASLSEIDETTGGLADRVVVRAPEITSFIAKRPDKFNIVTNSINPEEGLIKLETRVMSETSTDSGLVARIHFMPRKETMDADLNFVFYDPHNPQSEELLTRMTLNGEDKLGSSYDPLDGVANLSLQIYSSLEKAKERPVVKTQNERFASSEDGEAFLTHIFLEPQADTVEVGDIVNVDVFLANPDQQIFDSINLMIAYNPLIFEAIDGNDYKNGVNLIDEPYQDKFPFDFPVLNSIDVSRGIIDYRMQGFKVPIRSEGIVATIQLRAIRPTKKTTLRVFLNETGSPPTTGIFYRNQDRLGDPADPFDGVTTASITVQPTTAYLKKVKAQLSKG
ncbi:MAG: hypothetical protein ACOX5R_04545 [bacterium]